jgi:two-component system cell cycle sensor histidine kinase/response regulator CckA
MYTGQHQYFTIPETGYCINQMDISEKTNEQLKDEIRELRDQNADLKKTLAANVEAKYRQDDESLLLRDSYYRALFAHMLHGYAYCVMIYKNGKPQNFKYLAVNSAFEKLTGLTDVVGKLVTDVIPGIAESNPELFEMYGRVAETGNPEQFEIYVGPLKIWFSISVHSPQKEHFIAVFDNITDRKQLINMLSKSEEQYRLLFKNNPNPMWVYDLETLDFLAVNDAMIHEYGYSNDELMRMKLTDLNPPEYRDAVLAQVRTLQGEYRKPGVWLHKKKDGTVFYVEITTHDIEFSIRKARLTLARDITDRLKAEESLIESESKLRNIADTVIDAIILVNNEWKITYCNIAAEKMFAHPCEELTGQKIYDIIPLLYRETGLESFKAPAEDTIRRMVGKTYDLKGLRKDRTEFPIEVIISEVILKEGWHCTWIIRDITERKNLEEQLRQAQKMEAIGQLAGGIAHDFNNILTAIIGYGQIIRMQIPKDNSLLEKVDNILLSADRATKLTQSLLAFSRQQLMDLRGVDLNDIVRQVEKLLRRVIGEDIEFKTILAERPLTVHADSGQIEQVLINLATNARDAMPHGGSFTIETNTAELDETYKRVQGYGEVGTFVSISVSDTGIGMDEKTKAKIFEPFFTTKEVGKGTGLGLSMAYGIIKQHNGYITVHSKPGNGTAFKIYLPLIQTELEKQKSPSESHHQENLHGTETVLVVEDESSVREVMQITLRKFGYTVYEATDGENAIHMFTEHKNEIQLAIIDMIMPKKSGAEVFKSIKKIKPDIKAVFISGYTADRFGSGSVPKEGPELIQKPFSPDSFMKKVREILDRNV